MTGLLISSPQMRDPNFERTVILLCQHDEDGAMGLVINRDGPVSLGAVVEGMALERPVRGDAPTWWGGPVGKGTGFVLWEGSADPEEGWTLGGRVAVSLSAHRLGQLLKGNERFYLCLGYAGWGPGQLDSEIERGSWLYSDVDADLVFAVPLPERYERALAGLGLSPATVWMTPIDE